jgi:polyphosphate kinase 2 (PPK2 family)
MIKTFNIFVNEELKISKMDDRTLKIIKENFLIRLDEYREYILSNIQYDENDNKIKYKEFEKIDINVIIRELTNEFSKDFIKEMSVEMFLKKINELLELKNRNVKKRIRESFREYFNSIDKRIDNIKNTNNIKFENPESEKSILTKNIYNSEKYEIQIELLKLQEWVIKNNKRIAIVFEGRDAAGKGSTIKRFTEYLNPKGFKTVTLGIPSEYEKKHWFERYEKHLPNPGEIVFFDRSWYNRAVIEPAMGYCTEDEYNDFMNKVTDWEENLIKNGLILIKIWFSITKEKQIERF